MLTEVLIDRIDYFCFVSYLLHFGQENCICRFKLFFCSRMIQFYYVMHQSFETPAPPIRVLAGDCGDFHLIHTSFWFPGRRGIHLKSWSSHPQTIYLLAAQRSIWFFFSWLPTVFFNQCVTLGNDKLFYKRSTMCWKEGAGECTIRFCPREPGTSLTFTCIKSECPAQAWMGGGVRGFQMIGA